MNEEHKIYDVLTGVMGSQKQIVQKLDLFQDKVIGLLQKLVNDNTLLKHDPCLSRPNVFPAQQVSEKRDSLNDNDSKLNSVPLQTIQQEEAAIQIPESSNRLVQPPHKALNNDSKMVKSALFIGDNLHAHTDIIEKALNMKVKCIETSSVIQSTGAKHLKDVTENA